MTWDRQKGPPVRRPKKGQNPGLSMEKIYEMRIEFLKNQNLREIAGKVGADPRTVARYVNKGDPTRGVRPFREDLAEVNLRIQENAVATNARIRIKGLEAVAHGFKICAARMGELLAADGETLTEEASAVLPADPTGMLERLLRVDRHLNGEIDDEGDPQSQLADLTKDELLEYAVSGKMPQRERSSKRAP